MLFLRIPRSISFILMIYLTVLCTSVVLAQSDNPVPSTGYEAKVLPGHPSVFDQSPAVDVAILLDTSNSMDGLINQARSQLWTIVQQFARAEKHGNAPVLRVALFEYGNTSLPVTEGYLRQVVPLTDDLDVLSEALFSLTTDGGDEYCGQVIDEAITRLGWSSAPGSYQAVFIAGNEPFTQGPVDYHFAVGRAAERGIIINTIHCGDERTGVEGKWKDGADLAHGEFFNIDQDRVLVHIPCPQDNEIIRLNKLMNDTYLWFGSEDKRESCMENQIAQDSNAEALSPSVAVGRSLTKSSKAYSNQSRDLVDGLENDSEMLKNVPEEELPDVMQEMTPEERVTYIDEMGIERTKLKNLITKESVEREAFLQEERIRRADVGGETTLGDAVVGAIQKQLVEAGFEVSGTSEVN